MDLKFLAALVPPPAAEGEKLYQWRMAVAAILSGTVWTVVLFIMFAFGRMPGLSGFAFADDLKQVNERAQGTKVTVLDGQIFDIRASQCQKINAGLMVPPAQTQRLNEKLDEYRQEARREYRLPDCREL